MSYDPQKHHRRSIRLKEYDYSLQGAYFVTICTADRACIFGTIAEGQIRLSQRGHVAHSCWEKIPSHHPHVELGVFQIMPNHLHGILLFDERATQASPLHKAPRAHGPMSRSLGAVIGSFKSSVSRQINRLRPGAADHMWQGNYFEHIIRNDWSLDRITDYIITNPQRWEEDSENPSGTGADTIERFLQSVKVRDGDKEGDAGVAPTCGAADMDGREA